MFDIGWSELLLIGIVALIAIGPKELPGALRTLGQWMAKIRRMAAEFQGQFQEAMREAEIDQLKKDMDDMAAKAKDYTISIRSRTCAATSRNRSAICRRSTSRPRPRRRRTQRTRDTAAPESARSRSRARERRAAAAGRADRCDRRPRRRRPAPEPEPAVADAKPDAGRAPA